MDKILKMLLPAVPAKIRQSIYQLPDLVILTFQKTLILDSGETY